MTYLWKHKYITKVVTENLPYSYTLLYFAIVMLIESDFLFKLIKRIWIKILFNDWSNPLKVIHQKNLLSWMAHPCSLGFLILLLGFSSKTKIFPVTVEFSNAEFFITSFYLHSWKMCRRIEDMLMCSSIFLITVIELKWI